MDQGKTEKLITAGTFTWHGLPGRFACLIQENSPTAKARKTYNYATVQKVNDRG
jgi:hypothetical protein